tara:strand:- start:46 stop:414 length:369 start_codon:yes stop_codon:yes gene_type:complete
MRACWMCRRPMLLIRMPHDRGGPKRLHGALPLGFALYGLATVILVALFLVSAMPPRTFIRLFSAVLLMLAAILATDGALGLRTGFDRTGKTFRSGRAARVLAAMKLAAGIVAGVLAVTGAWI